MTNLKNGMSENDVRNNIISQTMKNFCNDCIRGDSEFLKENKLKKCKYLGLELKNRKMLCPFLKQKYNKMFYFWIKNPKSDYSRGDY